MSRQLFLVLIVLSIVLSGAFAIAEHTVDHETACDRIDCEERRNITGGNFPDPVITADHNPLAPSDNDTVNITAAAVVKGRWIVEEKCTGFWFWKKCTQTGKTWSPLTSIPNALQVHVDEQMKKECSYGITTFYRTVPPNDTVPDDVALSCSYVSKYPAGNHSYFAVAKFGGFTPIISQPISGEIKTATKMFVVTRSAPPPPPPVTGNASLAITAPTAGDEWVRGNAYDIMWSLSGNLSGTDAADLYLANRIGRIVPPVPESGDVFIARVKITDLKRAWSIPSTTAPSRIYYVYMKQVSGSLSAASDLFSIVAAPAANKTKVIVDNLQPASGPASTVVSVAGSGFTAADNKVKFGSGFISGLSSNGTTLRFTVPSALEICANGTCNKVPILPGDYPVSVMNSNGKSNSVVFRVIQTSAPTLEIIAPDEGDEWLVGRAYRIRWKVNGTSGPADVLLSQNQSNKTIVSGINIRNLSYTWAVPADTAPGNYFITIKAGAISAASGVFSLVNTPNETKPVIDSLNPSSAAVGASITIKGAGFTSSGNTVKFGPGYIKGLLSSDGTTLAFTVPEKLELCPPASAPPCLFAYPPVVPGLYPVSVMNSNGKSNSVIFNVSSAPAPPPPAGALLEIISPESGDEWVKSNSYDIKWSVLAAAFSTYPASVRSNVSLDLWLTSMSGTNTTNTTNTTNSTNSTKLYITRAKLFDGKYTWAVPAATAAGQFYILAELVDGKGSDTSDMFSVVDRPSGICGDCDNKTDDGLKFELKPDINMTILHMYVCNVNATQQECRGSSSIGIDKPLICEGILESSCSVKCFNVRGAYYVIAEGFSGLFDTVSIVDPVNSSYLYECPELDIGEILSMKENVVSLKAIVDVITVKLDILNATADNATKAKWEKYLTTFREISTMLGDHIAYLDTVLADPTPAKVLEAKQKTLELKLKMLDMLRNLTAT